jgi:hypothetical protein
LGTEGMKQVEQSLRTEEMEQYKQKELVNRAKKASGKRLVKEKI